MTAELLSNPVLSFWPRMSVDRFAELYSTTGFAVFKQGDVWWKQGTVFHRPLLSHRKYDLHKTKAQLNKFGVFQFGVQDDQSHNCYLNFIVFDNRYNVTGLPSSVVRGLKTAMKCGVVVRPISDEEEFASKGYPVYMSAFQRNQYAANTRWGTQRRNPQGFSKWSHSIFQFPETIILGAFAGDELLSFEISWLVEDTLMLSTIVHSDQGLELRAPDILLHTWRATARDVPGLNVIWDSALGSTGVDEFKLRRGGRAIALRAHVNISRPMLWAVKHFWPGVHQKIAGRSPGETTQYGRKLENG